MHARRAAVASVEIPAAETSTSRSTRCGKAIASSARDEAAHRVADDRRGVDRRAASQQAVEQARVAGDRDLLARHRRVRRSPGRSSAITRCVRANTGSCSSQFCQEPDRPCTNTSGGPCAELDRVRGRPVDLDPALVRPPVDVQPGGRGRAGHSRRGRMRPCRRHAAVYLWPICGSRSTSTRHCTTTGTCSRCLRGGASASRSPTTSRSRGTSCSCGASRSRRSSRRAIAREHVLGAAPYAGAVETVAAWHAAGHFIHVTSHRSTDAHDATAAWLEQIGLPLRRPALLVGQGHALRGDRHRRADRRQPAEHPARAGGRHRAGDDRPPVESRAVPRGGRHLRCRLAASCASASRRCSPRRCAPVRTLAGAPVAEASYRGPRRSSSTSTSSQPPCSKEAWCSPWRIARAPMKTPVPACAAPRTTWWSRRRCPGSAATGAPAPRLSAHEPCLDQLPSRRDLTRAGVDEEDGHSGPA